MKEEFKGKEKKSLKCCSEGKAKRIDQKANKNTQKPKKILSSRDSL